MKKTVVFLVLIMLLTASLLVACDNQDIVINVVFVDASGEEEVVLGEMTVINGKYEMIADPQKDGYEFEGWYLDKELAIFVPEDYFATQTTSGKITLYAKWSELDIDQQTYTVEFVLKTDGKEEIIDTQEVLYGQDAILPDASLVQKEGYRFSGWSDNYTGITENTKVVGELIKQVSITFVLGENADKYIGDDIVDGKVVKSFDLSSEFVSELFLPEFEQNISFLGWYYDNEYSQPIQENFVIEDDIILYAKTGAFSVKFFDKDNSLWSELPAKVGVDISKYEDIYPEIDGFEFLGWYEKDSQGELLQEAFDFSQGMPARNIELYPKYEIQKYTLTFIDGVGENQVFEVSFKTLLTEYSYIQAKAKTGYTFDFWHEEGGVSFNFFTTMPARDITLYAKYTINTYTLTFDDGVGEATTYKVQYGSDLSQYQNTEASQKTGYVFKYWYKDNFNTPFDFDTAMPADDITLSAYYQANEHKLIFVDGIGEEQVFNVNFGTELSAYASTKASQKTGHTFMYWYKDSQDQAFDFGTTMPDEDITLKAYYEANKYTLTFIDGEIETSFDIEYGTSLVAYKDQSYTQPEGKEFLGWYEEDSQKAFEFNSTMPDRAITLYSKYADKVYTITYYVDSQIYATQNFANGMDIYEYSIAPQKQGFTFEYWYSDDESIEFDFDITMPANNIDLYAKFVVNTYTLTFVDGVGEDQVFDLAYGTDLSTYASTKASDKTGYSFVHWYKDSQDQAFDFATTMPDEDITLTARYDINTHKLTFVDGVGENQVFDVDFGTDLSAYASTLASEKIGHTFAYWYKDSQDQAFDFATTMPDEDITLTAKYDVHTHTLTFVDGVGENQVFDVDFGTDLSAYASTLAGDKTGYTFAYWYENDQEVAFDFDTTMPDEDLTLYAKYDIATYTLTYYVFDKSQNEFVEYSQQTYEYGSDIAEYALDPSMEGHTFEYWYSDDEHVPFDFNIKMPAENIEVYAKFSANNYTIFYHNTELSETLVKQERVLYGTSLTDYSYSDYSYNGHTVAYWYEEGSSDAFDFANSTMPANDLVLYAYFEGIEYTVTYYYNDVDNTVASTKAMKGDVLAEPQKPADKLTAKTEASAVDGISYLNSNLTDKAGNLYVFAGWYTSQESAKILNANDKFVFETDTMTAGNLNLYAGYFQYATIDSDGLFSYNYHTFSEGTKYTDAEYTQSQAYIDNAYFGIASSEAPYGGIVGGHMLKNIPYDEYLYTKAPDMSEAIYLVYAEGVDVSYYKSVYGDNIIKDYAVNADDSGSYDVASANAGVINQALIDASNAYTQDGLKPVVYIVGGYYFTHQVNMQSNVTLRIARDSALVYATNNQKNTSDEALIYVGNGIENVIIEGPGKLIGMGSTYMENSNVGDGGESVDVDAGLHNPYFRKYNTSSGTDNLMGTEYNPANAYALYRERCAEGETEADRINIILTDKASNIIVRNLEVRESSVWTIKFFMSNNIHIHDVIINNNTHVANTDGIDVVSSSNVLVEHNFIVTGDDGIVLKTRAKDSNSDGGTTINNVLVRNNQIMSLTNGMKIGTETHKDISDVEFNNNDVFIADIYPGAYSAVSIETRSGASVSNVSVINTRSQGTYSALYITRNKDGLTDSYGGMDKVYVTGSRANDCDMAMLVVGTYEKFGIIVATDKPVNQVAISDMVVRYYNGFATETANKTSSYNTTGYPEIIKSTGLKLCNSYGLNVVNAKNVYVQNVTVISRNANQRDFASLGTSTDSSAPNYYGTVKTEDYNKTINGTTYNSQKGTIGSVSGFDEATSGYKAVIDLSWFGGWFN